MSCACARRRFLLDRADDGDSHARDLARRRGDERGERTLRVYRAATDEVPVLDAHRDLAAHRVDVTEKDDVDRSFADLAHRVAGVVDRRLESSLGHARDEPLDGLTLIAREAGNLDEAAHELDVVRGHGPLFTRSAARDAEAKEPRSTRGSLFGNR